MLDHADHALDWLLSTLRLRIKESKALGHFENWRSDGRLRHKIDEGADLDGQILAADLDGVQRRPDAGQRVQPA